MTTANRNSHTKIIDEKSQAMPVAEENPKHDTIVVDDDEEKKILRKIDFHLLPLTFITYGLQYLDKITLGYAAVLGIREDAHLVGQQYSWASSIFYFGFLTASLPGSYGFVKLPWGKYLAGTMICWAVVLACHGAINTFASLMVVRFILGALESVISPGFSLITGLWYKPTEHAWRHGIWFAGNGTAAIIGGLLSYAIGYTDSKLAAWRWIFIIFGLITFGWSLYFLRPQKNARSFKTNEWKLKQAIEAVKDPKTWLLFLYTFCSSFKYNTLETLLLTMPQGACQVVMVLTSAYLTTVFRKSRCIIIAILLCISLLGWILVGYLPHRTTGEKLFGVFIFGGYAAAFPLSLSMIASDVQGFTKKTVVQGILFLAYTAGNIAGPQVFFAEEAPNYRTGYQTYIICLCLSIFVILVLRQYMDFENKRRDRVQGVCIEVEPKIKGSNGLVELPSAGLDETDGEQDGFRYIL
ncbi:MFS general substrate transporter [Tothia fuscella]|uniref:MFS general substrate transporter n=1 Tax=Tothia fuscella TaxID=1048955 RepID=A0A9P4NEL0_9PEZI|nr:MFS general substrate transporter [Tothia fuscella]